VDSAGRTLFSFAAAALRKNVSVCADTVERWLCTHPEIEIVSRDRGGDYAAAARKGAPKAQQVADRFHLVVRRIGAC
jgi:transposase